MKMEGFGYSQSKTVETSRGVCIYYKDNLSVEDCTTLNDHNFVESCWCTIKLNNHEQILLGGIYRSPSSDDNNARNLNNLINEAVSLNYKYTILVGDFNYPSICWEDWSTRESNNHPSFRFIECIRDNYLSQFILEPTRYREGQR